MVEPVCFRMVHPKKDTATLSTVATPYRDPGTELMTLSRLAAPVVLAQLGMMAMGVVDIMMVAPLGELALSGITLGHTWSFGWLVILIGLSVGMDPLFSQAFGANKAPQAWGRFKVGARLIGLVCVPIVVLHWIAPDALLWAGQDERVVPLGGEYARIGILGILPFAAFGLLRQFLQGDGRMMPAAIAIVVGNGINIVLNLGFVYGYFGFPEYGPIGTAWATLGCRWFMFLALFLLSLGPITRWRQLPAPRDQLTMGAMVAVCGPVGAQISLEFWGFSLSTFFMGWFGPAAQSGHMLALNLASIAFMIPLGIGTAASTRVGNLLGARLRWQGSGWVAVAAGVTVMLGTAMSFWWIPEWLLWPYQAGKTVEDYALLFLPIAAFFAVFDGAQVVLFGVLRGAGDTALPALANMVGYYVLGIPLGLVMAFYWGWGPGGLWMGLAVSLAVVSCLLTARLIQTSRRGGYRVG